MPAAKPRLVVDENIPLATEAFGRFGEVVPLPGREISRERLKEADALVVRSVTRVDAALVEGTPVKFVGTATAGVEHIDQEALEALGVRVESAPGSNSRSVAEWTAAAILELVPSGVDWRGLSLGVVGLGRIGEQVATMGWTLGLRVMASDPPLEAEGFPGAFAPLDELLSTCDFVTIHVPLTEDGPWPTRGLVGQRELALVKPGSALLNASRGAVLDNAAALEWIKDRRVMANRLALDVFEGEPSPDRRLVAGCALATPHVAGYSWEGKVAGAKMIADALREHLGLSAPAWRPKLDPPENHVLRLEAEGWTGQVREAVRRAYDIRADDRAFRRKSVHLEGDAWPERFDALRKDYPRRREFSAWGLDPEGLEPEVPETLAALGFQPPVFE